MAVAIETSKGDFVVDLFADKCPKTCFNFLKLCKVKYYNNSVFYNVQKNYIAQVGDPTNKGTGGSSIWEYVSKDESQKYFKDEFHPSLKFNKKGLLAMAN